MAGTAPEKTHPFRAKVRELNRSLRFVDMQLQCNEVRSSAWWNNVYHGKRVSPPPPDTLDDIAELFKVTPARVAEMVTEDWYDVRRGEGISERVHSIASAVDNLSDSDFELIEQLLERLRK
jgi:HEPN domain-containing protein